MRAVSRIVLTVAAAMSAILLSTAVALAKGDGGIITLAAPIPGDAEPGSSLTVDFSAFFVDGDQRIPVEGAPMVLQLIGDDGTKTEGLAAQTEKIGTYRVTVEVPATGIDRAVFAMRGSSTGPDGSTELADIPFEVDGVMFALSHPNPVAAEAGPQTAASANPASPTDLRPAILAAVAVAVAIVAVVAITVFGRRRDVSAAGPTPTSR